MFPVIIFLVFIQTIQKNTYWECLVGMLGDLLFRADGRRGRSVRMDYIDSKMLNKKYRVCVRLKETPTVEYLHCSRALWHQPFNFTPSWVPGAMWVWCGTGLETISSVANYARLLAFSYLYPPDFAHRHTTNLLMQREQSSLILALTKRKPVCKL